MAWTRLLIHLGVELDKYRSVIKHNEKCFVSHFFALHKVQCYDLLEELGAYESVFSLSLAFFGVGQL